MPTKAQLPILAARVAVNVARERLAPARLASLDDVPPAASALTAGWLTAALCRGVPDAAVVDFDIVGGSDGTSSRRALRVTYNAAGQQAALPTRLFMKSASSFQSRLMFVLGGVTESETSARVGIWRGRSVVPPALCRRKAELLPAVMHALRLNSAGTPTLLHQDVHQGNWLRDPDGRMGLYDWQAVAKGEWALDFSYAMSVNLPIEDRRAWERDLLERYLWRLGEDGVSAPPSFDDAWLRYRQQPFHVVIFALFTIGAGRLQPDMQPKDYMLRCWERIATFVDDHESLDSLI